MLDALGEKARLFPTQLDESSSAASTTIDEKVSIGMPDPDPLGETLFQARDRAMVEASFSIAKTIGKPFETDQHKL